MKLMHLILSVAVFCSTCFPLFAQTNYSLWPRRPEELEKARLLLGQQKWGEAAYLLQPFIFDDGVSGREARKIVSRINIVRYLSRMHPSSSVYVVKPGDTLPKIATQTKCPVDLLMLYNGIVVPSSLKVGQKLVYIDMNLRMEIYPGLSEITVWDGDALVASYPIVSLRGIDKIGEEKEEIRVTARESYIQGKKLPRSAAQCIVANKQIRLSNGLVIAGPNGAGNKILSLAQADINELALLIREDNSVTWADSPEKKHSESQN